MAKAKKEAAELSAEELEIKAAEEAAAQLENEQAPAEGEQINGALEATFKSRPDLVAAYVNGAQYYFDQRMAEHFLTDYKKVSNPYYKA